jgi:scyllo-inositol 2-dehydrogenase (NADP+)
MKKLNVAIVGYGRSGRDIHAHLLKMLPEQFNIVAFADSDAQRRDMIKAELGLDAYEDYIGFFGRSDIDFVINASFSHHHAKISRELMKAGFDVLSEKPAAKDEAEFDSILKTAAETGKRYFVFQQYRFSPAFRKINEVIESGVLGRIVQVGLSYSGLSRRWDWQTIHSWTGGSLLNTGPHPVDHALAFMGFPQDAEVFAAMENCHASGGAEDYAKVIIRAKGCPVADIEISACNAYPAKTFHVQGTRGTLYGGVDRLDWKYYKDSENPPRELDSSPLRGEKGEPLYCREKLNFHEDSWEAAGNDFQEKGLGFYRAFYESFVNGTPFEITSEQIKLQMRVIGMAHDQNKALFEK